ncbi:acyl-CoA synthetase [Novosphingobium sp. ERW19]|jgi:fatty-acyl-CoA synthase|uniref:acyl-CoA synthetase n=1 Tax=Novosphingobium sp. ERW19 TaxID=2726186 RepID=UPI001456C921|nr:acyl-CoA synthetase [Novosphingobium sp. ERW19]NLR41293.1 acyl-CoA synthetase [Novosphingobium sp. ERW19]
MHKPRRPASTAGRAYEAAPTSLPADLPDSSYALLEWAAEQYRDRTAISFFPDVNRHWETTNLSYAELFDKVTRAANLFHHLGIEPNDVIALLLPNLPETHIAMWGAEATAIVFPLNPALDATSLALMIAASKARLLVTTGPGSELYETARAVLGNTPSVENVVVIGAKDVPLSIYGKPVHDLARSLEAMPSSRLASNRCIRSSELASYFCTGGTTGLPKIATRSHGQVIANAWMTARMFEGELGPESVLFCGLPLFHVNAVVVTGLMPFLIGASVLLGTPQGYRSPALLSRFWEIVADHRITGFSAVPTLFSRLLEHPVSGHDLSSLRFAICGAAPLSTELLSRFERSCSVSVVEGYGLTEAGCVVSINPVRGERRAGSVGLALPTEDIRIVILDEGGSFSRDARIGEMGVVTVAGPNVFSGYLDHRHNADVWIDRGDGKWWLNTGDLGRFDDDGYLWLTGRSKDLIIRGGHNIDPQIIEEALHAHPDVALAAAIGRPDAYAGEIPVAYVQLRSGALINETDLMAYAAKSVGERAAIPKAIFILDHLPLTAIGKIHKPSLRAYDLNNRISNNAVSN